MHQALATFRSGLRRYQFDTSILAEVSEGYRLKLAGELDCRAVNALRASAYEYTEEFHLVDFTPIYWDHSDSNALVLIVEHQGQVVASMRADLLVSPAAVVKHLDASWPENLAFNSPVMVLERAATRPEYRRLGLNSMLRYFFIKMAKNAGIQQIVGTIYQGASRTELMASLGYSFFPVEKDVDQWPLVVPVQRILAVLDLAQDGERALTLLTQKLRNKALLR